MVSIDKPIASPRELDDRELDAVGAGILTQEGGLANVNVEDVNANVNANVLTRNANQPNNNA